jgi:hypothetical protein
MYPGITHEEYLSEPADTVDWALAFAGMEAKMEADAIKKASQSDRRR